MLPSEETFNTWNNLAELYQQKFMHLTIYNESYDFLLKQFSSTSPAILEIGCGPGVIANYILSKLPTANYLGTDYAPNMISFARQQVPQAEFLVLDALKINTLESKYDALIAGFILPYISSETLSTFLTQCRERLVASGIFYLSYVNDAQTKSGIKTGSTGARVFFNYYEKDFIHLQMKSLQFHLLKSFSINYPTTNNEQEEHVCEVWAIS